MSARILLIEDDPVWEDSIVSSLEAAGYAMDVARTVADANEILGLGGESSGQCKYDLLIIDVRLPADHEGLQLVARLRELQDQDHVPLDRQPRVIVSTVLNHVAVAEWTDKARWNVFLVKPYEIRALMEAVRECLSGA